MPQPKASTNSAKHASKRRLPSWILAPMVTAGALDLILLVRFVGTGAPSDQLADLQRLLPLFTLAGVVTGGAPVLLSRLLGRLGYAGNLINGVITTNCYLLACSWVFGKLPAKGSDLALMLGLGTFFGLVVGHSIIHTLATIRSRYAWGPVDLAQWRLVPHMAGGVARERDVIEGRAAFYVGAPGAARPADLDVPALALLSIDGKGQRPVVVIQTEHLDGKTVAGVRFLEGGNAVCTVDELELVDEQDPRLGSTLSASGLSRSTDTAARE